MNKSFAALAVLISMAAPASAMSLRPGIEVGASYLTFVRGSDAGPYASDWSWHPSIGFVLESELPRRVRIASGVHWARGGARTHASDSYFDDSNEARESWLTGDLSIQPGLALGLRAVLGVEVAYLLSGKVSGRYATTGEEHRYDLDYTSEVKRRDVRLTTGIAYEFPVANHLGSLMCRYVEGLVQENRPAAYLLQRNIAWTEAPNPIPGGDTRVRAIETGITLYW